MRRHNFYTFHMTYTVEREYQGICENSIYTFYKIVSIHVEFKISLCDLCRMEMNLHLYNHEKEIMKKKDGEELINYKLNFMIY